MINGVDTNSALKFAAAYSDFLANLLTILKACDTM